MKSTLFLIVLSLIYCKTSLEKVECFIKNEKIIDEVANVIESLKSKDFKKIIPTAIKAFFTVKDEVKKCLKEEDPVLQIAPRRVYNPIALEKCKMKCGDYFYDYKCIKKCNEQFGGIIKIGEEILFTK